jgi:hypothetical protein
MKIRPLYKKLDTGFVDLAALLRHLRQRSFVGLVRIDIDNYRAEISFDDSRKVRMREFVNGTGQPSEGPGALHRLLARAREAGGAIDVYEAVRPMSQEIELDEILDLEQKITEQKIAAKAPKVSPAEPLELEAETKPLAPKIPKPTEIFTITNPANGNGNGNGAKHQPKTSNGTATVQTDAFPLYSEAVEMAAEQPEPAEKQFTHLPAAEWDELTSVTSDLLSTADEVLRGAGLGFTDAFGKARAEVSHEYPFLHPEYGVFVYHNSEVQLAEEVVPEQLVSGVCECLRRILNKLVANPKFFAVYRHITQQFVVLLRRRQPQFDKFGYTQKLEKIIKF